VSDLAERLAKATGGKGGGGLSVYEGQTLTVASIEAVASQYQKGTNVARVAALTEAGEEVSFIATPTASRQLFEIEDTLPQELKVVSFSGQGGNKGYKFELA
jgi:hypothetical protein